MPTKDKVGQMGYWENPLDPVQLTILRDERKLEQLEDESPKLFTMNDPEEVHPEMQKKLDAALEEMEFSGGFSVLAMFIVAFDMKPREIKWLAQIIGSCVASGAMRGVTSRMLVQILLFGRAMETLGYKFFSQNNLNSFAPFNYGAGRRRGNMRRGDGSWCGVHIESMMKDGILVCDAKGLSDIVGNRDQDYPEPQNAALYRRFGAWQYLDDLAAEASEIKLIESVRVRDTDLLRKVIEVHKKPCMICSGWGFAPQSKHKDGFWIYKRSGSWAHNMTITGIRIASDGNVFVEVTNSWGPGAHRDGPLFYIPIELAVRWLRDAVCMTIGDIAFEPSEGLEF